MHYKSIAFKVLVEKYLRLKKAYSDIMDGCSTGKNLNTVFDSMEDLKRRIKLIIPAGKTFVHGYLIVNDELNLNIYSKEK